MVKNVELVGSTDASTGTITLTAVNKVTGFIEKIIYDYQDGLTGVDLVFTAEGVVSEPVMTKANLGVADVTFYPRTLANKVADGTAFTDVAEKIFVQESSFQAALTNGGTSKDFRFIVVLSDE